MKLQEQALQRIAGAYAVGSLSVRARRRFESLLANDIPARRAWHQWEQRLSGLGRELPPVRPPAGLWQTIEQRIAPAPRSRAWLPWRWLLIAVLVFGVAVVLVRRRG